VIKPPLAEASDKKRGMTVQELLAYATALARADNAKPEDRVIITAGMTGRLHTITTKQEP
jgi:hypothetical protein